MSELSSYERVSDWIEGEGHVSELANRRHPAASYVNRRGDLNLNLFSAARQRFFAERLLRELAKMRLETVHELEMEQLDYDIALCRKVMKAMEADQHNPFLLAMLEQRLAPYAARVQHILHDAATRGLGGGS